MKRLNSVHVTAVCILALAGCDSGLLTPEAVSRRELAITEGDGQTGDAASALDIPLAVRVTNGVGLPVRGVTVQWWVADDGRLASNSSVTNASGMAVATRTLGSRAGFNFTSARIAGESVPEVRFVSFVHVQGALSLQRRPGDNFALVDTVGGTVPVAVLASDHQGEPVAGVRVAWTSVRGTLSADSGVTDDAGIAWVTLTLDTVAGAGHGVSAEVQGLTGSPVHIFAEATPGTPVRIVAASAEEGWHLVTDAPTYRAGATDQWGNYVEGVPVTWEVVEGGGAIDPVEGVTVRSDAASPPVATARHILTPGEKTSVVAARLSDAPGQPQTTLVSRVADAVVWVVRSHWYYWYWYCDAYAPCALFTPREIEIDAGGTVVWRWAGGGVCDVVFEDDPDPPASSARKSSGTHLRTFTSPGVYRYRCTSESTSFDEGMTGTVTVRQAGG